jgi:hypothetical protein
MRIGMSEHAAHESVCSVVTVLAGLDRRPVSILLPDMYNLYHSCCQDDRCLTLNLTKLVSEHQLSNMLSR